jgi:hypothetical protein
VLISQEEDARVAMVAIQLGKIDDAKQLYANCKRFDLLNQLHQVGYLNILILHAPLSFYMCNFNRISQELMA